MKCPLVVSLLLLLCLAAGSLKAQTPRIIGGGNAAPGDYPWIAALLDKNTPTIAAAQECAGALIHPYWVLTAAHCVLGLKAADLQVVVGATDLNASDLTRIDVLEIYAHPGHLPSNYDFDVALLLLAQPVTNVEPLEIIDDPALVKAGVTGTILGWGKLRDEDTGGTPLLQQAQLPIVDQTLANDADHLNGDVTENMFAAGLEEGGVDTCAGDSGGPLVVRGRNGQWVQAGIASWGDGCGLPQKPGVYTRVSRMRPWIQSIVWPHFAAWEATAGITADDGPDVDADGATQWLEYALRRNPMSQADTTGYPKAGIELAEGHLFSTLTVQRPAGGGDVNWGLQGTIGLDAWTALDPAIQQIGTPSPVPGDPAAELITWRGLEGVSGASFLRSVIKPGAGFYNARRTLAFQRAVFHTLHQMDTLSGEFRTRDYLLTGLPAGQSVTLTLRSDAFDSVLRLLNADTGAEVLASSSNTGGGNDEKINFIPDAGVRYVAQVTTQAAGGLGAFTLALFQISTSLPTISSSQTKLGDLSDTDPPDSFFPDLDYYSDDYVFAPSSTASVTILMSSTALDPSFSIINAETGELLLVAGGKASFGTAMQSFVPRAGVTYFIRASSYLSEQTGDYSLRTMPTPLIAPGDTKTGSLADTDGTDPYFAPDALYYSDDFVFTPASNSVVTVLMSSSAYNAIFSVLDSRTYATIAEGYGRAGLGTAMQSFSVQGGVSYLIRASSSEVLKLGNYSLKLLTTPSLVAGTSVNQQLSNTDGVDPGYAPQRLYYTDDYVFTAPNATRRTITATSVQMDMTLELIDAFTGESIAANDDESQGVLNSKIVFTPAFGRSYIIRVSEVDQVAAGGGFYTVLVQ